MRMLVNRIVITTALWACAALPTHAQSGETFTWIGGGCGPGNILWLNNNCSGCCECENWDPSTCLMGFFDTAIIPGGFVVHMVNAVEIGTIEAADSTVIITNNLTVGSEATMAASIDSSSGPVVKALGPITFKGTSIFSRGTLMGPDSFTVPAGSEFNLTQIGGGLPRTLDATLFKNHGTVNANLGLQFKNNATVDNLGTWNANSTLGHSNPDLASGTFNNSATLIKNSSGSSSALVPLNNAGGTIQVMNGTLNLSSGGNHSGGSYQPNGGSISLRGFDNNGTPNGVRITGPMTASGDGNLQLRFDRTTIESGGSLTANLDHSSTFGLWIGDETNTRVQCDGPIKNSGLMTWRGGTIEGSAGVENLTGGVLGLFSANGKTLSSPLLNHNGGSVVQSASLTISGGTVLNGGTWSIASGNVNSPDNSDFIVHGGTLHKLGTGTSNMHACYKQQDGVALVTQGTLDFRGGGSTQSAFFVTQDQGVCRFSQGTYSVEDNTQFQGSGEIRLAGATFNLETRFGPSATTSLTPKGFFFESGQIVGFGALVNGSNGNLTWSGGTIAAGILGEGGVTNHGTFDITGVGPAGKVLAGHLANQGDVTATSFTVDGGKVTNYGAITLTGGTIAAGKSPGNILNLSGDGFPGSINKIGGGTTNVWPPITNQGTINVVQGWLELKVAPTNLVDGILSGGTWRVWPNAALKMPGITIAGIAFGTFITLDGGSEWKPLTDHLIENGGVIRAAGAGQSTCKAPGGTLFNKGGLQCAEGGTLNVEGTIQNDPDAWMEGLPGLGPLPEGDGAGGFIATTVNNHGIIRPGGEGAPGPFNLTGNLVCHESSVIQIELAGLAPIDEHDQLNVTGDIALAGTLDIALLDDFAPVKGTEFTIMTATGGTISGEFDTITPPNFTIAYTQSSVTLTALAPQVPGDLNGDGVVGVADLLILLAAWGTCADPQDCPADLNGDGAVGVADLLILLANWG